MNNYTINLKVDGLPLDFSGYDMFDHMFEVFLEFVEESTQKNNKLSNLTDIELRYRGVLIANDIVSIIKIGTAISNFNIMITKLNGQGIMKYPLNVFTDTIREFTIDSESVQVHVVGNRQQMYSVFPLGILVCNLVPYFKQWKNMVDVAQKQVQQIGYPSTNTNKDHVINPVLQQKVDMNWTMEYYVPAELKKALASIDTNPEETKKILMVMDYMLSKGKI